MTYEYKIEKAREVVTRHNEALDDGAIRVSWETFLVSLRAAGGTTTNLLCECSWEDLQDFGLPKLLAREVAKIFRGQGGEPYKPRVITEAHAAAMVVDDLVWNYNPDEDNPVSQRLRAITKGQPCVVFQENGGVAHGMTRRLVKEVRDGRNPRETVAMDWDTVRVFPVGETPFRFGERNPLYPDKLLRPDGTCSVTERNWIGITERIRVTVLLAVVETQEIIIRRPQDAQSFLDGLVGEMEMEREHWVYDRCPKAAVLYTELATQEALPTLKVPLRSEGFRKADDPFYGHPSYVQT